MFDDLIRSGRSSFRVGFALLVLLAVATGCAPSEQETAYLARKRFMQRQNQGIRELIAEAEKGSLVPADQFLIGIDEKIVAELLRSELPIERPLGKRFRLRLETANVQFRDKFGVITAEGSVFRPQTPERRTAVRVHGGLGKVEIDPQTGLLNMGFAIDDIEILQAGILERVLGSGGKKLLASRGRDLVQSAMPKLQVPVGLAKEIRVPAVQEGAIALSALTIPLDVSVKRVIAARQKLWVTVDAKVGEISGGEGGVGVAVGKAARERARKAIADSTDRGGR